MRRDPRIWWDVLNEIPRWRAGGRDSLSTSTRIRDRSVSVLGGTAPDRGSLTTREVFVVRRKGWGGRRAGAGRKRIVGRRRVEHGRREELRKEPVVVNATRPSDLVGRAQRDPSLARRG